MWSVLVPTLALVLGAAPASAGPREDALAKLQARYETTRTMRATFQQTVESPTLAGTLESHGTVAFEKPNRMRWDYADPDPQVIVGDGQTLWLYQPDLKQVIKAPLGEAFQSSTPVTFLAGLGRVEQDFDATLVSQDAEGWTLRLVPKKDKALGVLTLVVRKTDASVGEARITDALGTTTRIRFADEVRNVALAADLFTFTPHPGLTWCGRPPIEAGPMPSFDVVCTIDLQEVDNAINQTLREVGQRFDFKNSGSEVRREDHTLHLHSADEWKVRALGDILREKLAKRQVPLKALEAGPVEPGPAGTAKQTLDLQQGIATDKAREIVKLVKDAKLKVQVAIQGDQVRVTGKKRDDLQGVIAMLRQHDLGIAMQFVNFRD